MEPEKSLGPGHEGFIGSGKESEFTLTECYDLLCVLTRSL